MWRQKAIRHKQMAAHERLIEPGKETYEEMFSAPQTEREKRSEIFTNGFPLVLELACGRGEYSTGLAPHYPHLNFLGIDKKSDRMRVGVWTADEQHLDNVRFLRANICDLDKFFWLGEVSEIWIIHPDPRPKNADRHRRLTSPRFSRMYQKILKSGGLLRLKTDDDDLFDRSLEQLAEQGRELVTQTRDLAHSELAADHHGIQTKYGDAFVQEGRTLKYGVRRKA